MSIIKLEAFKAGIWRQRYQYKSFEPALINHEWTFIRTHVVKEAQTSSRIEGTQTEIDEALMP
jgi:hypothetical protein